MERERARTVLFQEIMKPCSFADWIEHRGGFELLLSLIPDMAALKETAQNWYHRDDVWTHSLLVLKRVEQLYDEAFLPFEGHALFLSHLFQETFDEHLTRYSALRLTALLHDIGKPEAQGEQEGRITFIKHERIGSEKMETIGQILGLTEKEQDYMMKLIRYHLRPLLLSDLKEISPRALNRLSKALGDYLPDLAVLSWADVEATCGTQSSAVKTQRHHCLALSLLQHCRSGILDSSENCCNNGAEKRAENS